MIIIMNMNKNRKDVLKCIKCSYSWIPRKKPEEIKECPRCKSRDWRTKK